MFVWIPIYFLEQIWKTHLRSIYYRRLEHIMTAMQVLILYYQSDAEGSNKILNDKQSLLGLLEQKCLLILLKYIENITHIETPLAIKTLLLAVRLIKINPTKMQKMLSPLQIRINDKSNIRSSKDMSLIRCLIQKLETYYNYLIKAEINSRFPQRKELQILASNLLKISQSTFSKDKELARFCDYVYWMAQDELFQLWNEISSQIEAFQKYDSKQFHYFYQKYTQFCTFRRKIPKLKHKKLKEVIIKSDLNSKIELKWHQTARKQQFEKQAAAQRTEIHIKSINLSKLTIVEDFQ